MKIILLVVEHAYSQHDEITPEKLAAILKAEDSAIIIEKAVELV